MTTNSKEKSMNAPFKPAAEAATTFVRRHIGPSPRDVAAMLESLGAKSLEALMGETLPSSIRQTAPLDLGPALSETEALAHMKELAAQNQVFTSLIGQGYSGTILPAVIQRNILENPAWYTAYTPYQPEISQGRLEALFNFQTMICDLTGLDVANASLLDEATAAAEAMALAERAAHSKAKTFFVDRELHPQTLAVLRTRAEPLGWNLIVGDPLADLEKAEVFGGLLQYPASSGAVRDLRPAIAALHGKGALAIVAADLLAVIASMYAVYHGPEGLTHIARSVHRRTSVLAAGLRKLGFAPQSEAFFDTVTVDAGARQNEIVARARAEKINLRIGERTLGTALDETTTPDIVEAVWRAFGGNLAYADIEAGVRDALPAELKRGSAFLTHPVFHAHRSETELLRYMRRLSDRDLALDRAMIPLDSCTMKLNATSEMIPLTWPEFASLHPFAPREQAAGYRALFARLEKWLCDITGYDAISLQPNSGAQGEYAGLLAIRAYHAARGEPHRKACLIPSSAHGTNPASASMAGMEVVVVACDARGDVDVNDLRTKAAKHANDLAAIMITYPSTHGVFEEHIREICDIVHGYGGQVYLDGANLNAQVGLSRPGDYGADVSHLNLHKTFCIPHGGGGPGMGPIGVKAHLAPFLPSHPASHPASCHPATGGETAHSIGPVSAAPFGSASILTISYIYILMMGGEGLQRATEIAILNANYIAARLNAHFPVLYRNAKGRVAHECIIDP